MFGIGFTELLVIAIVALIFIGPDKLPDLARTVGKTFLDLKRAADDIKSQVTEIEPGRARAPKEPQESGAAPEAPDTKSGWAEPRADEEAEAGAAAPEAASPGVAAEEPKHTAPEAAEAEKPKDKPRTARKPRKKTGKTA